MVQVTDIVDLHSTKTCGFKKMFIL